MLDRPGPRPRFRSARCQRRRLCRASRAGACCRPSATPSSAACSASPTSPRRPAALLSSPARCAVTPPARRSVDDPADRADRQDDRPLRPRRARPAQVDARRDPRAAGPRGGVRADVVGGRLRRRRSAAPSRRRASCCSAARPPRFLDRRPGGRARPGAVLGAARASSDRRQRRARANSSPTRSPPIPARISRSSGSCRSRTSGGRPSTGGRAHGGSAPWASTTSSSVVRELDVDRVFLIPTSADNETMLDAVTQHGRARRSRCRSCRGCSRSSDPRSSSTPSAVSPCSASSGRG